MSAGGPFCAVCGKPGLFERNVCPECRAGEETEGVKKMKPVAFCRYCGRISVKGRWAKPTGTFIPKNTKCPDCHRRSSKYYTTVLKFSGLDKERKALVEKEITRALEVEDKRGKATALTRVDEKKEEYFFTHISTVRSVVKRLGKLEPIQAREDARLIGYDHAAGKGKYTVSVLVKFLKGA